MFTCNTEVAGSVLDVSLLSVGSHVHVGVLSCNPEPEGQREVIHFQLENSVLEQSISTFLFSRNTTSYAECCFYILQKLRSFTQILV